MTQCVIGTVANWSYLLYVHVLATYLTYCWLYFLYTCLFQLKYDRWNYHHHTIICHNTRSHKGACGTIRGCATNKNYYYINVVCLQIVLPWGSNQGYGINCGKTVSLILSAHMNHWDLRTGKFRLWTKQPSLFQWRS